MIDFRCSFVVALVLAVAAISLAQTSRPAAPATPPASSPAATAPATADPNPPATGFHLNESDPKAIELADLTMQAMGGREAWDKARYLTWKYFGNRRHLWDKQTGNIRFEFGDDNPATTNVILMNVNTKTGRAWMGGEEVKEPKQLESYLLLAFNAWQNDGNAIFLPYLLKGAGVTLKYKGAAKMLDGRDAEVISMTFDDSAGAMAGKKYSVCVGSDDHLVGQVEHFKAAADASPNMVTPWKNWRAIGGIMLSDTRGRQGDKLLSHTDVAVLNSAPEAAFTSPEPLAWAILLENSRKAP